MTEVQKILTELMDKFNLTKEDLASKMKVHTITITRWKNGDTEPTFTASNYLKMIYNGYKVNRSKK